MKNLITRSLSGFIYAGLIIGAIFAGPYWVIALAILFCVLGMHEFQTLTSGTPKNAVEVTWRTLDIFMGVAMITCCMFIYYTVNIALEAITLAIGYPLLRSTLALYDKGPAPFAAVGRSIFSLVYIAVPLALLNYIYFITNHLVLVMFIMIWLNDTGAYCVGSMLGRNKLFERLSPKKSWEGFFGGLAFCVIAGAVCHYIGVSTLDMHGISATFSLIGWIGMGITVCVFSTWGDLFESLMKRNLGVKDSGNLIPGHGGILDRIDSLLFVVPAILLYIFFAFAFFPSLIQN